MKDDPDRNPTPFCWQLTTGLVSFCAASTQRSQVETALKRAERNGFRVETGRAHWGIAYCAGSDTGKCPAFSINGSPQSADNEAKRIDPLRHTLYPPQAMNDYTFTLCFLAPGRSLEDLSTHLYEQIDDASLMGPDEDGSFLLEFDRQASNLPDALVRALTEILSVLPEATILRVDEYDLATMADIARRAGRTPESVRLLVNGRRGPGGFPPAAGHLDGRTKVWRWADVAEWFECALGQPLPDTTESAFLQAFNDALEIRRLAVRLGAPQLRAIAGALPDELAA